VVRKRKTPIRSSLIAGKRDILHLRKLRGLHPQKIKVPPGGKAWGFASGTGEVPREVGGILGRSVHKKRGRRLVEKVTGACGDRQKKEAPASAREGLQKRLFGQEVEKKKRRIPYRAFRKGKKTRPLSYGRTAIDTCSRGRGE